MKFYKKSTVQKGRGLSDPSAVNKRLAEIKANKKSAYHKYLNEGKVAVLFSPDKQTRKWDIVVLHDLDVPDGIAMTLCAECQNKFFNLEDDYLCEGCRSEM